MTLDELEDMFVIKSEDDALEQLRHMLKNTELKPYSSSPNFEKFYKLVQIAFGNNIKKDYYQIFLIDSFQRSLMKTGLDQMQHKSSQVYDRLENPFEPIDYFSKTLIRLFKYLAKELDAHYLAENMFRTEDASFQDDLTDIISVYNDDDNKLIKFLINCIEDQDNEKLFCEVEEEQEIPFCNKYKSMLQQAYKDVIVYNFALIETAEIDVKHNLDMIFNMLISDQLEFYLENLEEKKEEELEFLSEELNLNFLEGYRKDVFIDKPAFLNFKEIENLDINVLKQLLEAELKKCKENMLKLDQKKSSDDFKSLVDKGDYLNYPVFNMECYVMKKIEENKEYVTKLNKYLPLKTPWMISQDYIEKNRKKASKITLEADLRYLELFIKNKDEFKNQFSIPDIDVFKTFQQTFYKFFSKKAKKHAEKIGMDITERMEKIQNYFDSLDKPEKNE